MGDGRHQVAVHEQLALGAGECVGAELLEFAQLIGGEKRTGLGGRLRIDGVHELEALVAFVGRGDVGEIEHGNGLVVGGQAGRGEGGLRGLLHGLLKLGFLFSHGGAVAAETAGELGRSQRAEEVLGVILILGHTIRTDQIYHLALQGGVRAGEQLVNCGAAQMVMKSLGDEINIVHDVVGKEVVEFGCLIRRELEVFGEVGIDGRHGDFLLVAQGFAQGGIGGDFAKRAFVAGDGFLLAEGADFAAEFEDFGGTFFGGGEFSGELGDTVGGVVAFALQLAELSGHIGGSGRVLDLVAQLGNLMGFKDAGAGEDGNDGGGSGDQGFLEGSHGDDFGCGNNDGLGNRRASERGGGNGDGEPGRSGLDGVGGDEDGEPGGAGGHAAFGEILAEALDGPGDAFLGGFVADAEEGGDFGRGFLLKIAQQEGVAVGFIQFAEGGIEVGSEFFPRRFGFGGEQFVHGGGLLFTAAAANFGADGVGGEVLGGAMEPAGEDGTMREPCGVLGEGHKDALGDVLGQMCIADHAQGRGIDQVDVPPHQFGERGFGTRAGEITQELLIGLMVHSGE